MKKSCNKNVGILFDVSGSMNDEFQNFNKIDSLNDKKSDELITILKNLLQLLNIFIILFGLKGSLYIIDFIKLLEIYNNHFKTLEIINI